MAAPMDDSRARDEKLQDQHDIERKHRLLGGIFMTSVAGMSTLFGFSLAIAMAKKKDPSMFNKGLSGSREITESGASLALRALGWGTFYAMSGFTVFCFGMSRLLGTHTLKEFREKMQMIMPEIPKSKNPGRSDFKDGQELVDYIVNEGKSNR